MNHVCYLCILHITSYLICYHQFSTLYLVYLIIVCIDMQKDLIITFGEHKSHSGFHWLHKVQYLVYKFKSYL